MKSSNESNESTKCLYSAQRGKLLNLSHASTAKIISKITELTYIITSLPQRQFNDCFKMIEKFQVKFVIIVL